MSANLPPPDTTWSYDEAVIRRFEAAWHEQDRPDIETFLSPGLPDRNRLLAELVHVDLEFRLRAGEPARVENYLNRFPELTAREVFLDLIATEFAVRNRYAQPVAPDEYLERFPAHRTVLTSLLSLGAVTETRTPDRRLLLAPPVGSPVVPGLEIVGELGRGGMGIVYRALQPALNRVVAIKTLAATPGTAGVDRFQREAETVARLDHPHIVPIYEVGTWSAGGVTVPYFVMKYYPGGSLDGAACGPGTDPKDHARLLETVALAVHHAHLRGVLHRDLKPSNILLDESGQPHVADFGLAGCFDPNQPAMLSGAAIGTPAYMAPEQARGTNGVSPSADVYGLGAILYQRLTGHPPFLAATPLATLELVTTATPVRPAALNPRVSRDLETICLKCLQKEPSRRYASAAELAQDLQRLRTGRPILARRTPAWEHGWRWARRNPTAAILAGLAFAAIVMAIVILAVSNARVTKKEAETATALVKEREAIRKLRAAFDRERHSLYLERVSSAGRMYGLNQLGRSWNLLDACPEHLRDWEWYYLDRLRSAENRPLGSHTEWVCAIAFLTKNRLATADVVGEVRIWDLQHSEQVRAWRGRQGVMSLSSHPEQPWLAVADARSSVIWNTDSGEVVYDVPGGGQVAEFSADGSRLAVAVGPVIRILDTVTWEPVCELAGHQGVILHGTFDPAGERFASCGFDRTIRVWNLQSATMLGPPRTRPTPVRRLAFSADGAFLFEEDLTGIALTKATTGEILGAIDPGVSRSGLAIGPTHRQAVVSGASNEVVIWDLLSRRVARTLRGHTGPPTAVAVSRDHRKIASGGGDRTIRVWELADQPECRVLPINSIDPMGTMAVAPGGKRAAVVPRVVRKSAEKPVRIIDLRDGRELLRIDGAGGAAFTADGSRIAVGRPDGGVAVYDAETGELLWSKSAEGRSVTRIAIDRNNRRVASGDLSGMVRVWDLDSGQQSTFWSLGRGPIYALAFTSNGDRLIATSQDVCTAREVETGTEAWTVRMGALAIAIDPEGSQFATADRDRIVRLREMTTGQAIRSFEGSPTQTAALAFATGGRRLASGDEHSIRIWDVETAKELLTLPSERVNTVDVAWQGPDLLTLDYRIRIWTGAVAEPPGPSGAPN